MPGAIKTLLWAWYPLDHHRCGGVGKRCIVRSGCSMVSVQGRLWVVVVVLIHWSL